MSTRTPPAATGSNASTRVMILLVALVCAAPFLAAWVAYYVIKPQGGGSYGQLLRTTPVPPLDLPAEASERVRSRWIVLMQADGPCGPECERMLYATRQAHTMLGKERSRVQRVLIGTPELNVEQQRAHPDLLVVHATAPTPEIEQLLRDRSVLLDPLGNQVIAWPRDPDIKKLNQDLMRLLRASRIG
ncbi:MAG: hypothetical protein ACK4XK_12250 [Casimicrobiaceae bacterium]